MATVNAGGVGDAMDNLVEPVKKDSGIKGISLDRQAWPCASFPNLYILKQDDTFRVVIWILVFGQIDL